MSDNRLIALDEEVHPDDQKQEETDEAAQDEERRDEEHRADERRTQESEASALWRRRRTARAFDAVRYAVPGVVPAIAQPSPNTCWATVATMLMSWHDRASLTIEDALTQIGPEYVEMFRNDRGLPLSQKGTFLASIGLQAEPPMNYDIEGWAQLLRRYGPVWVTTDEGSAGFSPHARVLIGIEGDGTPNGTMLQLIDPDSGTEKSESVTAFVRKYEQMTGIPGPLPLQVVHYPPDAQRATAQSYTLGARIGYAMNPAAIIAGAGVGWQVLKEILMATRDIQWERQWMTGVKCPDDDTTLNKGPWSASRTTVSSWVENLIGDRQEADFEVTFRHNGTCVADVTVENTGTNDAFGWKLYITEAVTPAREKEHIGPTPIAAVDVLFNFRHYAPIRNDAIYVEELTLFGDGTVSRTGRWTQ